MMADFRLACGICQTEETVDAVCHHCSLPLCAEDRIPWRDNAFHRQPEAIHCIDCWLDYHVPAGSLPLFKTLLKSLWWNSSYFRALLNGRNRPQTTPDQADSRRFPWRRRPTSGEDTQDEASDGQ